MTLSREIKAKITSVEKIQKLTKAMQNVAASKMRRAKQCMLASMPYATKIREVVKHFTSIDSSVEHPYLRKSDQLNKVGYIVVSTDRGLCGGLNLNLFKLVLQHAQSFKKQGVEVEWCLFGKKAEGFFKHNYANISAHINELGESPKVEDLLGAVKVMLDGYKDKRIDRLFLVYNEFISTIYQNPVVYQLLPLAKDETSDNFNGDYIYEPSAQYYMLLDTVVTRYLEAQIYQSVVDNMACEQVARMVAMQNATDNSKAIIDELKNIYNKARQSSITNEIAEIIGGADAVCV